MQLAVGVVGVALMVGGVLSAALVSLDHWAVRSGRYVSRQGNRWSFRLGVPPQT